MCHLLKSTFILNLSQNHGSFFLLSLRQKKYFREPPIILYPFFHSPPIYHLLNCHVLFHFSFLFFTLLCSFCPNLPFSNKIKLLHNFLSAFPSTQSYSNGFIFLPYLSPYRAINLIYTYNLL